MANEDTTSTQTETTTSNTVVVPVPEPGQALTVTVEAEQIPQLNFDPGTESTQEFVGTDLVFTLDNGAVLTFEDFAASINDGEVTSIMLEDGSIIPIDALIAAWNLEVPETAAGEAAASGGGSAYGDDMGDALGGIDKLGTQNPDPFGAAALSPIEDEQTPPPVEVPEIPLPVNQAPVAVDNTYRVQEGVVRTFGRMNGDDEGLLNNDFDPDGDPINIVFADTPSNITVNTDDGSLTVNTNGSQEELSEMYDALDDGETIEITFPYTITDPSGATDSANVTIIIEGVNDAPAIEVGGQGKIVYEAGLPEGSGNGPTAIIADGTFTVSDPDGLDDIASITLGDQVFTVGNGPGEFADLASMVGQSFETTYGTVTITGFADGTFTFEYELDTPTTDVVNVPETDSFNVAVSDEALTASDTVTVEIVDDEPTADDHTPDPVTATEDTAIDIDVNAEITAGADGVDLVNDVTVTTDPTKGTVEYNDDGTFTYTPTPGQTGTDSFVYTVEDGDGDTDTATVNIQLAADSKPLAVLDTATVDESDLPTIGSGDNPEDPGDLYGSTASGNLLANDTVNSGADAATITEVDGNVAVNGVITVDTTNGLLNVYVTDAAADAAKTGETAGYYEYTLQAATDDGVDDSDTFSYTLKDGDSATTSVATLTVGILDDEPTADDHTPDPVTAAEDAAIDIDVNAEITAGADGVDLVNDVTVTTDPTKGTVEYNDDGTFTYTPTPGQTGTDSFVYTVEDGDGDTDTATVNIMLTADSKPLAVLDTATVDESDLPTIGSGDNPEDPGDLYGSTASGNLLANDTVNSGADAATITEVDGNVAVNGVITVDTTNGLLNVYVTDAAADAAKTGETAGYYEYTLQAATDDGVDDSDTFSYTLKDGDSATTSVATLTVGILDDEPTADDHTPDPVTAAEDAAIDIDVNAEITAGADGVVLATGVEVTTDPTKGTVDYNDDGTFTYTPTPGQTGADSFVYTVTDGDGDTDTATVNITLAADSKPLAVLDTATVDESDLPTIGSGDNPEDPGDVYNHTASGNLLGNDTVNSGADAATITEVDGETAVNGVITVDSTNGLLNVYVTDAAADAAKSGETAGYYEYTLQAATDDGVDDSDTFSYTLKDGDSASTSVATLTVSILDDEPTADDHTPNPVTPAEDTAIDIDVNAEITAGADGVVLATGVEVTTDPTKGTVDYNDDGTFTYTPTPGQTGADSFVYTVTDGDGDTDTATVNITLAADSKPLAVLDTATVDESDLPTIGSGDNPEDPGDVYNHTASGNLLGNDTVNSGADAATITEVDGETAVNGVITVDSTNGLLNVYVTDAAADAAKSGETAGYYEYTLQAATDDGVDDSDTFSYTLKDGDSASTSVATLTVSILDDEPTADDHTPNPVTPAEDTAIDIDVNAEITAGADGVVLATGVEVTTDPTKGTVDYNDDGTFTYTPTPGQTGADFFVYTVTDGDGDTDTATVNITLAADSKPLAVLDTATVDESDLPTIGSGDNPEDPGDVYSHTASGNLLGNDTVNSGADAATITEVDGETAVNGVITVDSTNGLLNVYVTDAAADAAKSGETAGYYEYTLQAATDDGVDDSDTFSYTLKDGDSASTSVATLTVSILDDEPVLGTFMEGTIPNEEGTVTGMFDIQVGADNLAGFNITGPALTGVIYSSATTTDTNGVTSTLLTATVDPDGPGGDPAVTLFTLDVSEDGTYVFDLVTPEASTSEDLSLSTLTPGGPDFRELEDDLTTLIDETGRIEFTSSGSGVNANSNNFGVSNTHIDPGEWFEMEFHNPGAIGDDGALTNPELLTMITIDANRQSQGDVTARWTAYNDVTNETASGEVIISGTGDVTFDPSIEFNRIRIENFDDPNNNSDGGRWSAASVSVFKTILPSDQDLAFKVTATDGDGDVTSEADLYIHIVAENGTNDFTLTGADGVDDAIAGSSLADAIAGGTGSDIVDYSDSTDPVSINLDNSGNASGTPSDLNNPADGEIGGGDAEGDSLTGIEGALGGTGSDVLVGNDSVNYLDGAAGNDILVGGDDNDFLFGSADNDTLTGDGGADTFGYTANGGEGTDSITDFNINEDVLRFEDVLDGGDGLDQAEIDSFTDSVSVTVVGNDLVLEVPDQGDGVTSITLSNVADDYATFTGGTLSDLIDTAESINVDTYAS